MSQSRGDDPYAFGSAFSDQDDDLDHSESPTDDVSAYSNPFASEPTYNFGATSDASTLSDPSASSSRGLDLNRIGSINVGTVSPALGVYSRGAAPAAGLDYVFAEDYKSARKKSGPEQLTYLAGSAYLTGGLVGGAAGLVAALRESAGKTGKLRVNAVLNGAGKRGALFANSLGVLALMFSLGETGMHNLTHDDSVLNYAAAGAIAGGLFKSTRGLRAAGVCAGAGAAVAVGVVYASREGIYGRGWQGIL
jgi:Tim17/Tim22/Tim23/Pmp24 family